MKKVIKTLTLGVLLTTGSLFGGGNIAPVVPIEEIDPNPFYIGIGLVWTDLTKDCICLTPLGDQRTLVRSEDTTWGGIIRAGYDYNQYFGIEARALKSDINGDFSETTHYGIFLKPMIPIGEQMNVYGLLGYGHTKIKTDCGVVKDEFTHNGFSYGIGFEYDLSDKEYDYEAHKENEWDVLSFDREFDGHGDQEKGWGLFIDYQNLMHDQGPNNYRTNIISFGITYDF